MRSEIFVSECDLQLLIDRELHEAGFVARRECGTALGLCMMRCDIVVRDSTRVANLAVIECKLSGELQDLAQAMGQAIIYQRAFKAEMAVVCTPSDVIVPAAFALSCESKRVVLADERDLIEKLLCAGGQKCPASALERAAAARRGAARENRVYETPPSSRTLSS